MRGGGIGLATASALLVMLAAMAVLERGRQAAALANCTPPAGEEGLNGAELSMLAAINAERSSRGLGALTNSPSLSRAAAWKSFDSSAGGGGFGHVDSLGRNPTTRARDCEYGGAVGENIAYGYPGAAATLAAWMSSAGHAANILGGGYRVVGLGVGPNNAWTADFGSVDDSGGGSPPPPPTSTPYEPPTNTPYVPPTSYVPATNTPYVPPTFTPYVPGGGPLNPPTATRTPRPTRTPTATPTPRPSTPVFVVPTSIPAQGQGPVAAGVEEPVATVAPGPEGGAPILAGEPEPQSLTAGASYAAYWGLKEAARVVLASVDRVVR